MRIALVWCALVACGDEGEMVPPDPCQFENVIARDVPSGAASCGMFGPGSSGDLRAAGLCAANMGNVTKTEFVVTWVGDSGTQRAYYGVNTGTMFENRAIASTRDAAGHSTTTTSSCISYGPVPDCNSAQETLALCIYCAAPTVIDTCVSP
jgi:hypothetical protein